MLEDMDVQDEEEKKEALKLMEEDFKQLSIDEKNKVSNYSQLFF